MADNPRIEELRRRVQKDPASIAFAQLSEEHRRAGDFEQAIEVARAGLQQHPAYLSARVTLGRALLELGRLDEAAEEFEYVVRSAPDNLTAVRQLADIHQRRRQSTHETRSKQADTMAPLKPTPPVPTWTPSPQPIAPPVIAQFVPAVPPPPPPPPQRVPVEDPVLIELEAWLAVLTEERSARGSSSGRPAR